MLGRVRERRPVLHLHWYGGGWHRYRGLCPHQHPAILIHSQAPGVDQFVLESLKVVVIQIEPYLEGAIGHPPLVLEQIEHLAQNGVECHDRPSAWARGPLRMLSEKSMYYAHASLSRRAASIASTRVNLTRGRPTARPLATSSVLRRRQSA